MNAEQRRQHLASITSTTTPAIAAVLAPVIAQLAELGTQPEGITVPHHDCPLCALRQAADSELMTALLPTVSLIKIGA